MLRFLHAVVVLAAARAAMSFDRKATTRFQDVPGVLGKFLRRPIFYAFNPDLIHTTTTPEVALLWDPDDGVLVVGHHFEINTTDPAGLIRELRLCGMRVVVVDADSNVETIYEPLRAAT